MVKSYQYSEVLAHDGPLQTVQLSTRSCSVFASGATDGKLHVWAVGQPNQPIVVRMMKICNITIIFHITHPFRNRPWMWVM